MKPGLLPLMLLRDSYAAVAYIGLDFPVGKVVATIGPDGMSAALVGVAGKSVATVGPAGLTMEVPI